VQFLLDFKIGYSLEMLKPAPNSRVVVVCAGSGMDSEYLVRRGLKVIATDISFEALQRARERARRYELNYDLLVADAEALPFASSSAHYAFVHDGMHHLPNPRNGVHEMCRVSSNAVAINEPARSFLTRLAVLLGISVEYEDAGNYIHRFTAQQLSEWCNQAGADKATHCRHLIYYQDWTHPVYQILDSQVVLHFFKLIFHLVNALVGRWGNSLKFVARHRDERPTTGAFL
jgi:ubiquinone/menaquinone biosynthesis C-methylase UbiE